MGTIIWRICAIGIVIAIGWTVRRSGVAAAGSGIGYALVSIMTTVVRNPMVIAATIACPIGIALDMTPNS